MTKDVSSAVDQFLRKPYGNYTDVPHQPYLGKQLGRDGKLRGGVWNAGQMLQSAEIPRQELGIIGHIRDFWEAIKGDK